MASEPDEPEDPPANLKSSVWEHFGFRVKYEDGNKQVDKTKAVCRHCRTAVGTGRKKSPSLKKLVGVSLLSEGTVKTELFLLIFRRAAAGELHEESGLMALARLSEINVSTEGVMGAKDFFEAKMQALSLGSKFEAEIREEKEERKRQEVEKKQRQAAFKQLQSTFCS